MSNLDNQPHWSFFPAVITPNNKPSWELNIVRGEAAVKDLIVHYLLSRKGEHPIFPELGLPDLVFRPVNEVGENVIAQIVQDSIEKLNRIYNWGLTKVTVIPETETNILDNPYGNQANFNDGTFYLSIYLEFVNSRSNSFLQIDYNTLARNTEELLLETI